MTIKPWLLGAASIAACVAFSLPCAAEPRSAARDTYQRGKVAYDAGDFGLASRMFAEADLLAPNPKVLELAMAAAGKADDPVLGMELTERASSRGLEEPARLGRELFAPRVGRVTAVCPDGATCSATLDGVALTIGKPTWATVGEHHALLEIDGTVEHVPVKVLAEGDVEVRHKEPEPAGPPPPPTPEPVMLDLPVHAERSRPSPIWFWVSTGVTAALGGASLASGLDTVSLHDEHRANPMSRDVFESGQSAETRTNVLLVSTGVAVLATAAVAYLVFRPKEISHGSASAR